MDKPLVQMKEILPETGLWNLQSLSAYLDVEPGILQQRLTEKGIKTLILGERYKMRMVSMSAIANYFEKVVPNAN